MTDTQNTDVAPEVDDDGNIIVPATEDVEGGDTTEKTEDTEDVIPMRHSAQQIITRQRTTIEKLRSKDDDPDVTPVDDPLDDDLSEAAQGAVQREVKKALAPVMDNLAVKSDEDELSALYSTNPDARAYDKQIRKYMEVHPTSTPGMIYHHLAFDNAEATGSTRRTAADTDAAQQTGGGTVRRPVEATDDAGIPTVEEQNAMSDEDFEKVKDKALRGGFVEN